MRSLKATATSRPDNVATGSAFGARMVSVSAIKSPFMQIHAVEFARKIHDSLEKFTFKTLASAIKKVIDLVNTN